MHTVIHEGHALQAVSAILYSEKKTRFEGCDQGRVVSQRRNRNTEVKNSLFKTKKKLVFVKNKKETQQSLHADVGPCVCKQRIVGCAMNCVVELENKTAVAVIFFRVQ